MGGWDIWILPVTADKGKIGQIKFRLMFRILTAHNQYYVVSTFTFSWQYGTLLDINYIRRNKQSNNYVIERRDLFSCCVQVRTHCPY